MFLSKEQVGEISDIRILTCFTKEHRTRFVKAVCKSVGARSIETIPADKFEHALQAAHQQLTISSASVFKSSITRRFGETYRRSRGPRAE